MFITMRHGRAGLAKRLVLLGLAALAVSQMTGCVGAPAGGGFAVKSKPPKLSMSARRLSRAELRDYLDVDRPGKRRTFFRKTPADFSSGVANRRQRDALGGGTVWVSIMPEDGNFLVDTASDFAPARGVVVAMIFNEGPGVDSVTGLAAGDTAYWFVERDSTPGQQHLRSLIVSASNPRNFKQLSFEVCHRPAPNRPPWTDAKADFIDPDECSPPLSPTPPPEEGRMGSSVNVAWVRGQDERRASWIPCIQGCCTGR
jgi:hypothetical protein